MQPEKRLPLAAPPAAMAAAGLHHRVLRPQPAHALPPYPTVVMLHGYSGNEDVMWTFARALPAGWLLLAPRAIYDAPAVGHSWTSEHSDAWPTMAQFEQAISALVRFIGALPALYQADTEQLYLLGFSQGAALSYALALRYPALVQGIAGLLGFAPIVAADLVRQAPLRDLPLLMAVGRRDNLVPYSQALACAQTLRAAGADLEYHEYDAGHKLNREGMQDLAGWWADQARTG